MNERIEKISAEVATGFGVHVVPTMAELVARSREAMLTRHRPETVRWRWRKVPTLEELVAYSRLVSLPRPENMQELVEYSRQRSQLDFMFD